MKTRQQKVKEIEQGEELLKQSRSLVFVDFTSASVEDLKTLRKIIREAGTKLKVIKKKLMRIIFERNLIDFNPEQFESQTGIIFTNKDVSEIATQIYKFYKEKEAGKKGFKILGGYDLAVKNFIDSETMIKIGKLPPREVLLSRLVGVLVAPLRMFLYVLNEKGRKT